MLTVELESIIEAHDQPFVVIDQHYRIVAANRRYCANHGVEAGEIIDRFCHEVSHHSPRPCHENGEDCPHRAVFATGVASEVVHVHFHHHDQAERVRIRGLPIRGADGSLLLGEIVYPLESEQYLSCEDMRMVGHSPAFLACIDSLARMAESEASILLYGESGVGKELAARYVHEHSSRSGGPFVAINCAAVPENMFENELFGHERGAFTGSTGQKQGLFELANGGSLFLDEVAEIPLALQAKLLRVLETGEFRRVGGTATLHADVRIISATNRNLLHKIDIKRFRQDLYYRLAGIDIVLPSLRQRREDIPALAEAILAKLTAGRPGRRHIGKAALAKLKGYDFPGNIRELRNVLQRALVLSREGQIDEDAIRFENESASLVAQAANPPRQSPSLKGVEKDYIRELLDKHGGHRRTVADLLGISERSLYRKLRQYDLN
jgi:transcriptional regulator with PAS, ATPase and Fis domain